MAGARFVHRPRDLPPRLMLAVSMATRCHVFAADQPRTEVELHPGHRVEPHHVTLGRGDGQRADLLARRPQAFGEPHHDLGGEPAFDDLPRRASPGTVTPRTRARSAEVRP